MRDSEDRPSGDEGMRADSRKSCPGVRRPGSDRVESLSAEGGQKALSTPLRVKIAVAAVITEPSTAHHNVPRHALYTHHLIRSSQQSRGTSTIIRPSLQMKLELREACPGSYDL